MAPTDLAGARREIEKPPTVRDKRFSSRTDGGFPLPHRAWRRARSGCQTESREDLGTLEHRIAADARGGDGEDLERVRLISATACLTPASFTRVRARCRELFTDTAVVPRISAASDAEKLSTSRRISAPR